MVKNYCHYYDCGVESVYNAYIQVASEVFNKECDCLPYRKIKFNSSSAKYLLSASWCAVHFMPYGSGTAVYVRYSSVGLANGRTKAHDEDYTEAVEKKLKTTAQKTKIKMHEFSKLENQVTPQNRNPKSQTANVAALSNADELKKYSELLNAGIITQEEFEAKKKQILGL